MAWDAGSITNAAPWATLSGKLQTLVGAVGVENWSFVENVPAGTGVRQSGSAAYSLDVYLCQGTNTRYNPVSTVNKLNAAITTDGTSFAFSGVAALSASKVFTVSVVNTKATITDSPSTVTLDGANAPTFTKIADKVGGDGTGIIRTTVWLGKSSILAPTGTNLTVDFGGGNTQTACMAILDEWTGLDDSLAVSGIDGSGVTQVVVQAATGSGTNQTAHTATLGAALGPKSVFYAVAGETASAGTYSVAAGWTATAADLPVATPAAHARAMLRPDIYDLSPVLTLSVATAETSWAFISLELQRSVSTTALTTLNDATNDWYFVIEIPVPDGAVTSSVGAFQRFESGLMQFGAPTVAAALTVPVLPNYWNTNNLAVYASVTGNNRAATVAQQLNTSGFNYWIKLTKNGIVLSTRVGNAESTNGAVLLDSFVTNVTDSMPLISVTGAAANSGTASTFCTLPGVVVVPGTTTTGWDVLSRGWTQGVLSGLTTNATAAQDLWASGLIEVARIAVGHAGGNTAGNAGANDRGYLRGLWKTDWLCFASGGTVQLGDTMTIAGNTWTVIGKSGFYGNGASTQSIVIVTRGN